MASRLFICSFYIPNERRPLSHGITAVYLFLLCTERNTAVKSRHNHCLLVPSIYRTKRGRSVMAYQPFVGSFYIPCETRPFSHGITAVYWFLLYTVRTRALSHGITAVYWFLLYTEQNAAV